MKRRLSLLLMLLVVWIVPVMAQDSVLNIVKFNDFSFGYDSAMATGVNIYQFPGDPLDLEGPGGPQPPYTSFTLYQALPVPEYAQVSAGEIRVYDIALMPDYSFYDQDYQQLLALLTDRPDLTPYMQVPGDMAMIVELPYLPIFAAGQAIRAQAKYVETDVVQGISYITAFRQDVYPFTSNEFLYTFQGISKDGSRYISVVVPVSTPLFPAEIAADFNMDTFFNSYNQYLTDSVTTINNATPEDFTPSPVSLEVMLQTFTFDG
jgi:hypothetical protein